MVEGEGEVACLSEPVLFTLTLAQGFAWCVATGNSGRESTWGCYPVKQKYHLPYPPFFYKLLLSHHTYPNMISATRRSHLSHICWGLGLPPPPPPPTLRGRSGG